MSPNLMPPDRVAVIIALGFSQDPEFQLFIESLDAAKLGESGYDDSKDPPETGTQSAH